MREKFVQLPSIQELEQTLATESPRVITTTKQNIHYASLNPWITFLNYLEIDTKDITLDKTWQDVRAISERLINQASPLILGAKRETIASPAQKLYAYLSEENPLPPAANLIMTFGAKTKARVEKAIELYKDGLAPKLLFSGGSPLYAKAKPEAETYKELAIESGVPEEDIYLETKSITLADNVRSSLNMMDEQSIPYGSLVVVNSPYAQRRSYSHLEKFSPEGTKIYRVNCTTREGLRVNDWFTNEEGIIYVMTEYYKLWFGLVINTN